jgi:hypothetical protein
VQKDCGCVIHDGPHWLYWDTVQLRLNLQQLVQVQSIESLRAFGFMEMSRLNDLEAAMRLAGMAPNETIETYLERVGWPRPIIDDCLHERATILLALQAAIACLAEKEPL